APYAEAPEFYSDWSDVREFTIGDLGIGECAGEMVSLFGIEVVKAESQGFDAQIALEEGDFEEAEDLAYRSMISAARALVRLEFIDVTETPDDVVSEFKTRYFDNERFFDRFAKGKFGQYLLDRHATAPDSIDRDIASRRIEESQLFIEAAHACELRIESASILAGAAEA
ncbi:MAG: nitrite/sulfite reductase, partial [Myxococcales bacterium]|nr:nitrite/sulfite reductase [Myxococcales bacterium]